MWKIEFYRKRNGKCPTQEFLDKLSPSKDLPFVRNDLERLEEFGYELRRPQVEYLGDKIYELRTETMRGQIRLLYFFFEDNKIIITHGLKKTQKIPEIEKRRAIEFRSEYISQQEEKRNT